MAKIYAVHEVSVIVGAKPIGAGRGDGDFVRIAQADDRFGVKHGVDGEATYFERRGILTRVTVILMQSALDNDVLSAIHSGDIVVGNGIGVVPLIVKDMSGRSLLTDPEARIAKYPDQTLSLEPGTLEWDFLCPSSIRHVGGN